MSAPNAGPPVTAARNPPGSPARAASRSAATVSSRSNPDSAVETGTGATAARRSAEIIGGAPDVAGSGSAARIRSAAAAVAARSASVSAAPSVRVTTSSTGARAPSSNAAPAAAARAASAPAGTSCGDCSPAVLAPTAISTATPTAISSAAGAQQRRPVTAAAKRPTITVVSGAVIVTSRSRRSTGPGVGSVGEIQRHPQRAQRRRQRVVLPGEGDELDQLLAGEVSGEPLPGRIGEGAGAHQLVDPGDQGALAVGEPVGVGAGEDRRLGGVGEAALAADAAVVLQLVFGLAQMPDAQDHQLGVGFGQSARAEQHPGERQPRPQQPAVLAERGEQMGLRHPLLAGGEFAEHPVEQPQVAQTGGHGDAGRKSAHL